MYLVPVLNGTEEPKLWCSNPEGTVHGKENDDDIQGISLNVCLRCTVPQIERLLLKSIGPIHT